MAARGHDWPKRSESDGPNLIAERRRVVSSPAPAGSRIRAGRPGSTRPDSAGDGLLPHYATRLLTAVELNNTFYQQPSPAKVAAWLAATPAALPVRRQGAARRLVPLVQGARRRDCPG